MGYSTFNSFDNAMFNIIPVLVVLGVILVFGLVIAGAVRNAGERKKNNDSPVLTVDAAVVAKRTEVRHSGTNDSYRTWTTCFATFEVESGDRMEFEVKDREYGLLVERDHGKLTFQGTRYLGFERV